MNFTTRNLTEYDYNVLVNWWKFWRFTPPPQSILPNNGLGGIMIVDEYGYYSCAGFLYETNSKIAWIEYIVSNPNEKDKKTRNESLKYLILELTSIAEEKGYIATFSSIKNENLINKYIECGYVPSLGKCTELTFKI